MPSNPSRADEVIALNCPACGGSLKLRRKHVGLPGLCVHCGIPVEARGTPEGVRVVRNEAPGGIPGRGECGGAPANGGSSWVVPAPDPPESPMETVCLDEDDGQDATRDHSRTESAPAESPWGFPQPRQSHHLRWSIPNGFVAPTPSEGKPESTPPGDPSAPATEPSSSGTRTPEIAESAPKPTGPKPDDPRGPLEANAEPLRATETELCDAEDRGAIHDPDAPALPEGPTVDRSLDFPPERDPVPPTQEAPGTEALTGAGPPDETFRATAGDPPCDVAEPPTTGEFPLAGGYPTRAAGLAETLFPQAVAPPPGGDVTDIPQPEAADLSRSPLFAGPKDATAEGSRNGTEVSAESAVLDGGGRPMRPMTREEKDSFARERVEIGGVHERSPWVRRGVRFLLTLLVLGGIGCAACFLLPRDTVASLKTQVMEWLEPGEGMLDFLPFELGESSDRESGKEGESGFRIEAVDGLDQLGEERDRMPDASERNLGDPGAVVPEQQEAPDLPRGRTRGGAE